jgi:hypothetical protein
MASCYGDVLAVERQELESSKGRVWLKSGAVFFLSTRSDALARHAAARAEAEAARSSAGGDAAHARAGSEPKASQSTQ